MPHLGILSILQDSQRQNLVDSNAFGESFPPNGCINIKLPLDEVGRPLVHAFDNTNKVYVGNLGDDWRVAVLPPFSQYGLLRRCNATFASLSSLRRCSGDY